MEKIVLKRLTPFIDPLLSPKQSGFRAHDGTTFQLLRLVQEWCNSLDSSHLVGVVFFDFKKAFYRVCLPGLIKKLQSTGLQGKSLDWCCNFLTGRCQRVCVGGCLSSLEPLQAGVPQGAILSPLFFSLYINDVVASAEGEFNLFADDTSAYGLEKSPAALHVKLQGVMDSLSAWFKSWAVAINFKKSALMVLSRKRNVPLIDVQLDGQLIAQVVSHKHLGLVFNQRLSWTDNTDYVIRKASRKIGLLRRLRSRLPHLVLRSLYLTCVRPTLEYACGAWAGVGSQDAARLERTQRAAARLITGTSVMDRLPRELLLARAGLEPLSLRRKVLLCSPFYRLSRPTPKGPPHLVTCFKAWSGAAPASQSGMQLRSSEADSLRLPRPRTELLRSSPFYQAVSLLNSIPAPSKRSWSSVKSHILSLPPS